MKEKADKEEILRVLQENGEPTKKFAKRSYIHQNGLWHEEVSFIPINSKNELLIQKRSRNKKSHPNCWGLCAGHVTGKQTALQAAIMEANEELGLQLKENDLNLLVEKMKNEREDNKCYATTYYKLIDEPIDYFTKQDAEVEELRWISFEDFKEMVKTETDCIFRNNSRYNAIIENLQRIFKHDK